MERPIGTVWCDDRLCRVYQDSQDSDPHAQRVDYVRPICTLQELQDMVDAADSGLEQVEDEDLVRGRVITALLHLQHLLQA